MALMTPLSTASLIGSYLNAKDFNTAIGDPDTIDAVDTAQNHYESEE